MLQTGHVAFLLTNNPARWTIDPDYMTDWVEATARGHGVEGRWSTGSTTKKINVGDRAFLLRQGTSGRGIFASGSFATGVFQDDHWDGSGGVANYADVIWDTALEPEDALTVETLMSELPDGQWEPQASGSQVKPDLVDELERLWADHVASVRGTKTTVPRRPGDIGEGQGRRLDASLRKAIEDLAQQRLTELYESDGWVVEDLRVGNPFDAKATKGDETLYLEAKGTTTKGSRVIVTRGEVAWAREHSGECIIGILSEVVVSDDGSVDSASGTLREYIWEPADGQLQPLDFDFYPDPEELIGTYPSSQT